MKDIVIVANFCRDFSETDNGRFTYLCKLLSNNNKVEIITSDFNHAAKKHKGILNHKLSFKITFLHEPGYKKNISIQRFFSHFMWGKEVGKYLNNRKKPDVIYSAVPSLTGSYEAARYCKRNNIRFVIDIQDLWPEAFKLVFNMPVISNMAFVPFKIIADRIYDSADSICGVSMTYVNRASSVNKKCNSKHVVFLGTELSTFDKYASDNFIKKPENEIWIVYCGTLGVSYDITIVIDALLILKKRGITDMIIKFIVLGDGEYRRKFERYAEDLGLECKFMGRLPYDRMCGWLAACDIAVNPIMHNAAQSITNKHGDYAAAGIPVLNTQENQEYRDLVKKYNMGLNSDNGNAAELANNLEILIKDRNVRLMMGKNARKCAEEKFDRKNIYQELYTEILL